MNADARWNEDVGLFSRLVEEGAGAEDPRARELLARRPEWRELLDGASAAETAVALRSTAEAEADRRLVAECLAEARQSQPAPSASVESSRAGPRVLPPAARTRLWPRVLLAIAATLALAFLARMWWTSEHAPRREPGRTLVDGLDSALSGQAAPDFSRFEWTIKGNRSAAESFCFSVWAATPDGTRGERLLRSTQAETYVEIAAAQRAAWPSRVIWRVDRIDASGATALGREWRAERAP